MAFWRMFFHKVFNGEGFGDVDVVKFVCGVFLYDSSDSGCDGGEGVSFLAFVHYGVYLWVVFGVFVF